MPEIYLSTDVETDGPVPGSFSMLSLGLVVAGVFFAVCAGLLLLRETVGSGRALLRREGLYSSHLTQWRQQLQPGPKVRRDERDLEIEKLERKTARLEHELLVARKLIELAGKARDSRCRAAESRERRGTLMEVAP